MCGPSTAAPAVSRSSRRKPPHAPSRAACAGPELLAHVLVSKYCDHLPLYRQSQIYALEGIELERSILAE